MEELFYFTIPFLSCRNPKVLNWKKEISGRLVQCNLHKNYYLMLSSIFNYPETDVGMPWSIMIIPKVWDFEKPIEGIFTNCDTQNFTNNLLFVLLIYSENLICLSWVKNFFQISYGSFQPFSPIAVPQFLVCFSHHQYPPNLKIWPVYVEQFKSSKFTSFHFRGNPRTWHPLFSGVHQFVSKSISLHDFIHLRCVV